MHQVADDIPTPRPRGFAWIASAVRDAARRHQSPREVGAAVGAGVFIGCSPFFGFHTAIAAAVSWLCGLNFVYVWMGTHISNPFFAAFLTAASIAVGGAITGSGRGTIAQWSLDWLVGWLVVGSLLGSASGIAAWIAVRRLSRR
jgi:Uncharacterized protein conserved in bacteria